MSRARYWRHGSAYKRGHRMTVDGTFFGQSVLWNNRRKHPLIKEEQHTIAHRILIEMGYVFCLRCTRGWHDNELDAEAQQLGVSVVRIGEIALQATSEHHLPPWGMKPTVLDRRNLLDLHTLTRMH